MTNYLKTDWNKDSEEFVNLIDELPFWSAPFGLKLLDHIDYRKGINVLDIGSGTGFPALEIAMRLGCDSKIIGIDPWASAIDRAKRKINLYGIKNIEIIRGVAENIPVTDKSMDLIVSNNGLNNVDDINKSLSECARIIKPGGQFIQSMNLQDTMIEFYSIVERVLKEGKLHHCIDLMKKHIYKKRKPLGEYIDLIEKHGFSITALIHDQFEYKFADGSAMLNHFFIRAGFMDGWKSIFPTDRQLELFLRVESIMNKQSQKDGFFKLTIPFVVIDSIK